MDIQKTKKAKEEKSKPDEIFAVTTVPFYDDKSERSFDNSQVINEDQSSSLDQKAKLPSATQKILDINKNLEDAFKGSTDLKCEVAGKKYELRNLELDMESKFQFKKDLELDIDYLSKSFMKEKVDLDREKDYLEGIIKQETEENRTMKRQLDMLELKLDELLKKKQQNAKAAKK